jgi:uncharacterized membrane protein YbhN (UPF0104 family)
MPSAVVTEVQSVGAQLAGIDPRLALLALALHVTNHLLRSAAWRNVLAAAYPGKRVPLGRVAAAYASGVALNAVAPARGGDAAKLVLARAAIPGSSVPAIAATMSVLVLFDLVAATVLVVAIGLTGAVPLAPSAPSFAGAPAWVATHVAAGLAIALALGALAWVLVHHLRPRLATLWQRVRQGGAILRTPARYAWAVALPQTLAWGCRVGVVLCLLAAFGLPASVPVAGVVMVLTGASTLVPLTPGGVGTQQVMLAFALSQTASAAAVVSFSLGMQAGVTAVNALLGVVAAMAICRTHRPIAAVRDGLRLVRAGQSAA